MCLRQFITYSVDSSMLSVDSMTLPLLHLHHLKYDEHFTFMVFQVSSYVGHIVVSHFDATLLIKICTVFRYRISSVFKLINWIQFYHINLYNRCTVYIIKYAIKKQVCDFPAHMLKA